MLVSSSLIGLGTFCRDRAVASMQTMHVSESSHIALCVRLARIREDSEPSKLPAAATGRGGHNTICGTITIQEQSVGLFLYFVTPESGLRTGRRQALSAH